MTLKHNADRRRLALENYYQNPNRCKNCHEVINVPDCVKVKEVRLKVFCSRSCSAAFNNHLYPKRKRTWAARPLRVLTCEHCGNEFYSRNVRRKNCDPCIPVARYINRTSSLMLKTKGMLFSANANWQSARSSIRAHAYKVFKRSGAQYECYICGYNHHIEIAHLRPVSDFPNEALISEINALSNLIALCPNHHWELDHGLLKLDSN